jgi:hypothetical protein
MKPIDQMTLPECIESLQSLEEFTLLKDIDTRNFEPTYDSMKQNAVELADRIADLTRWIPVSERMPTAEDLNELGFVAIYDGGFIDRAIIKKGVVKVWDYEDKSWADFDASNWELSFTHWKRITPPEGA